MDLRGPDEDDDAWYNGEEPWGRSLVVELQRLRRRAVARPILTLGLAILMTGLIVVKVARKPPAKTAYVVMAVSEGALATGRDPMPVRELKEYVDSSLLPDKKLAALLEEEDLFRLQRTKLGMPFAISLFRDMFEVTVYRNYFLEDLEGLDRNRTARIELAVTHADSVTAIDVAHRLASIIVDSSEEVEAAAAANLQRSADEVITRARARVEALEREATAKIVEYHDAEKSDDPAIVATVPGLRSEARSLDAQLLYEQRRLSVFAENTLRDVQTAGAMAAGLGLRIQIVSERPPPLDLGSDARLRLLALVAFILFLPVAAIAVGAFDARIHDAGDVTRLGFTSLGHLPGYAGDRVGSLRGRGVRRRRAAQY